jgi:peptidoglycan/LPS O-acetylase OafA/YrhL
MAERCALIDFLKGVFILGILFAHSAVFFFDGFGFLAVVSQACVAGFVLLLAYNYFGSLERHPVKEFYWRRLKSYAPWIALAWVASALFGLLFGVPLRFGGQQAIGFFPVPGAGNYFVPLLIQLVVLAPLLVWGFKKAALPFSFLALGLWFFSSALAFEHFTWQYNVLRFLPFVLAGFLLAEVHFFKEDWQGVPVVNWFGRHSLKIFLAQILVFSEVARVLL